MQTEKNYPQNVKLSRFNLLLQSDEKGRYPDLTVSLHVL